MTGMKGAEFAAMPAVVPAVAQEKFKAATTFTVIADIVKNLAGDAAIVESITKPTAENHNYQLTPGVAVSDGVEPMGITEGPYEGKPNPHARMSPTAALI